jgi:hypothetical protein
LNVRSEKHFLKIPTIIPGFQILKLGRQTKMVYHARDGKDIQGVLVYPLDYELEEKNIH